MKTINYAFACLLTLSAVALNACSDDDGNNGAGSFVNKGKLEIKDINLDPLSRYTTGMKNATYTRSGVAFYNKDDKTDGLWEAEEIYENPGVSVPLPQTIVVNKGKSWEPIVTSHPTGCPTYFSTALWLVNSANKTDYHVYIARDMETDAANLILKIGTENYNILQADEQTLALSQQSQYWAGRTGNGGMYLFVATYTLSEPITFDDGDIKEFADERDAYNWLIEQFSDTFGESANQNQYTHGQVIFNQPMIYLSDLVKERDELYGEN